MSADATNELPQFTELHEVTCGTLSVVVDFCELLHDHGDDAYAIIGKLKDLLT